jgi:hypothetical protein
MNRSIPAILAAFSLAACANNARVESAGDVNVSSTPVNAYSLPAGSQVVATLDQAIGTKVSKTGDSFWATVQNPVVAQNGQTVVPSGARIHGTVTGVQGASNPTETAVIKLDFDRLEMNGRSYPFEAKITATNLETRRSSDDTRNETIKKAGIGAAAGAVLGAVLSGGDLSKILIGGALGAAAGTAISLGVGSTEAVLPAGSQITMQTTQNVALR